MISCNSENKNSEIKNIGVWQDALIEDEFGDAVNGEAAILVVKGTHSSATILKSEIYVKCIISNEGLRFKILNEIGLIQSFPDNKLISSKVKFKNDEVKYSEMGFYQNNIIEANRNPNESIIYNHLINQEDEIKILIDLSLLENTYSDKFLFSIKKGNLKEILPNLEIIKPKFVAAKKGDELYRIYCKVCHGLDGKLDIAGATDLTKSKMTLQESIDCITEGKGLMTAYKELLSEKDIETVAKYISATFNPK